MGLVLLVLVLVSGILELMVHLVELECLTLFVIHLHPIVRPCFQDPSKVNSIQLEDPLRGSDHLLARVELMVLVVCWMA